MATPGHNSANRADGYAPLRDYAAIGYGRTVALVALDGSSTGCASRTWTPRRVLGALLDVGSGERFALCPVSPFEAERPIAGDERAGDDVSDASGVARVTDAMTLPGGDLSPQREVVRAVEAVAGSVSMRWNLTPRSVSAPGLPASAAGPGCRWRPQGADALALCSWGAGEPELTAGSVRGTSMPPPGCGPCSR